MPVQYKIIKTITYLLYGFEKIAQNRNNERIFTERFETNIALYISSLVVQFGIEDEKLKEIISKINLRLKKVNIDEPDGIGVLVEDGKHEKANSGGGSVVQELSLIHI